MERDKTLAVEQAAKDHLKSLNIDFGQKNEKDDCQFIVAGKNGLVCVQVNKSPFIKTLYPDDSGYPIQGGGVPCDEHGATHSYRFVMDMAGKIIVDIDEVGHLWSKDTIENLFVDEQNIFLPTIDKEDTDFRIKNKIQHFRIQNGHSLLVNTFNNVLVEPRLNTNKLVVIDGQLYDYQRADFIGCRFDSIHSGESYRLDELAQSWGVPYEEKPDNKRKEFVDAIVKKMTDENLLVGISEISAGKNEFYVGYNLLVFLDMKGNPVRDLHYVDDKHDLLSVPVSSEYLSILLHGFSEKANLNSAKKIAEKQKADGIFDQIKDRLFK